MSAAIAFSVLMVYLMFASVRVAIAAAQQGGAANSIMVFSVIVTYGCMSFHLYCVEKFPLIKAASIWLQQSSCNGSLAYVYQLCTICDFVSHIHYDPEHVS